MKLVHYNEYLFSTALAHAFPVVYGLNRVVMMPYLLSLMVPEVVNKTTTSNDKSWHHDNSPVLMNMNTCFFFLIIIKKTPHRWLNARLQYLHC